MDNNSGGKKPHVHTLPWLFVLALLVAPSTGAADVNATEMALQRLEQQNFLVGIASAGVGSGRVDKCLQELEIFLLAAAHRKYWSVKVIESFGNPPRSFAWGNNHWFSSPALCEELNSPRLISLSRKHYPKVDLNITSPVLLRFTVLYMNFTTPHFINMSLPFESLIHLGLCLPTSCSPADLLRFSDSYFQSQRFEMQQNFELQIKPIDAKIPTFNWHLLTETGSVLLICGCLLIITLTVAAELVQQSRDDVQIQQELPPISDKSETTPTLKELLLCFHFNTNYKLATSCEGGKSAPRFLAAIAGLRTITCLWITAFHVYYYSLYAMSNALLIFAKLELFVLQPILQAYFYVDLFFVISALLLVYNFLSNAQQMQRIACNNFGENLKLWLQTLAHRYLRLTPIVIVIMLLSDCVHNVLNVATPFRLGAHSGIYCKNSWWHNLLYIQNFLDMDNICCSWTWYLACEMQYFVIFTALLYVYAKCANAAKLLYATLLVGFVALAWLCNYRNGITFQLDVIYSTLNQLYAKPWVRVIPYFGGSFVGWCLFIFEAQSHGPQQQQKQKQQQLSSHQPQRIASLPAIDAVWWHAFFWLFAACIYVATNFMSYWRSTTTAVVAAIMSLGKLLFALVAGGVIALCASAKGGRLGQFLGARIFLKLNKFCFSVYLMAPVIIFASFGLRNEATNFTEVASANDVLAVIVLSFSSAFLLVLFIEIPTQRLSNVLLKRRVQMANH